MKKPEDSSLARRDFMKMAAVGAAAGVVGVKAANAQNSAPTQAERPSADLIVDVSAYIAGSAKAELPREVIEIAKQHILDTLGAMVSGSQLKPGQLALKFIQTQGGTEEAQVVGSKLVTSAINAAFTNGMMAHSDETDDSNGNTLVHPGAPIVSAALAMSEREGADGSRFLKGVVVGYDVGCRMILALDRDEMLQVGRATPGIGSTFGAASASASIARINKDLVPYVLDYATQQASGINSWARDKEHVEKAFVFAGMGARNGVTAALVVQSGFTGVSDAFSGESNFINAFSSHPHPRLLTEGLGHEYQIMLTDMKRFPAGFPIQAAADATVKLIARGLTPKDIKTLTISLPIIGFNTVNDGNMPDINLQYLVAATLIDGTLKFETAHNFERMKDPAVLELKKRIVFMEDKELTAQKRDREGNIEVIKTDGTIMKEHGLSKGTIQYPMTREDIEAKVRELMIPILGPDRSEKLIQTIWNLEEVKDMRELRPLLSAS